MSEKYQLYLGDKVKTVSLWVREGDNEYPIYANTRGQCSWYTHSVDEYENTSPNSLSNEFIEWLAELHCRITGVGETTVNRQLPDLDWYEVEIINSVGNPVLTEEQSELLAWAYEQEQSEGEE